jgi:uncharacterized protein with HEPN domain
MKDERLYLVHMLEISRRIAAKTSGLTRAQFDANEDLQLALVHLIQTVGEAARLVSDPTRDSLPSVPWKSITGMRHRLVHDYSTVNLDVVFWWRPSEFLNWSRFWHPQLTLSSPRCGRPDLPIQSLSSPTEIDLENTES